MDSNLTSANSIIDKNNASKSGNNGGSSCGTVGRVVCVLIQPSAIFKKNISLLLTVLKDEKEAGNGAFYN